MKRSRVVMAGRDLFNLCMPVYGHGIGFPATAIGSFGAAAFIIRRFRP